MKHSWSVALAGAVAAMPASVWAQQPDAAQPEGGIGEIVVTAQRRAESLQRVPIAITAIAGETLAAKGITTTADLAAVTPGLTTTSSLSRATPFLRGIGSASADPGQEAGVATYVDGVYYASPQANVFALSNIERIEVLKGPQGTLFGRNATGGLIQIITRDPSANVAGDATVSYGNYDTVEANAYVTGGLAEGLAADLSLYRIYQGRGWGNNLLTGRDINFRREWSARSKVKWSDDLTSVVLAGDYQRNDSDFGTNRNVVPGARLFGGVPFRGSIYDAQGNVDNFVRQKNWGTSLKINRDLDFADLQSVTAYRSTKGSLLYDQDSSPTSVVDTRIQEHQKTFQQEVLLNVTTGGLNLTAGVFYYQADSDVLLLIRSGLLASQRFDLPTTMKTKSIAGFAQGSYRITDQLAVTAGARYTSDTKSIDGRRIAAAGNSTASAGTVYQSTATDGIDDDRRFNKLTYRFALDYQATPDVLLYASYGRGFKSGTFVQTNPFNAAVRPETIDAEEIGLKSSWFDRRLRFNAAAFHYNHKDIQLSQTIAGATVLLNAAKGRVWGLDAELTAVPLNTAGRLEITAGVAVLDATYVSFPNAPILVANPAGGNVQIACPVANTPACDASGNDIIKSPDFTSSLGVDYSLSLGPDLKLGLNALWSHTSRFYWEADNRVPQRAYDVVNAQVSIGAADDSWFARAFARNLLDKQYYQASGISTLGDVLIPAAPRTYGVTLGFRFR